MFMLIIFIIISRSTAVNSSHDIFDAPAFAIDDWRNRFWGPTLFIYLYEMPLLELLL